MKTVTASAPGSIMVIGEHAVVQGAPALVAAVEQRAFVTVQVLEEQRFELHSEIADPVSQPVGQLVEEGPYRFLAAVINDLGPSHGLRMSTRSEINPTLGLGSSAAITIAALGALTELLGTTCDLHQMALSIVRRLQGRGSGADLGASLRGGMISYQLSADGFSEQIAATPMPPQLALRYVGYKTPTGEVLASVAKAAAEDPHVFGLIYDEMRQSATLGVEAARQRRWGDLADQMNAYQELMARLGVSDDNLDALVAEGRQEALAAKISGSGLGDCVLAFGAHPKGWEPVVLAQEGLAIHE